MESQFASEIARSNELRYLISQKVPHASRLKAELKRIRQRVTAGIKITPIKRSKYSKYFYYQLEFDGRSALVWSDDLDTLFKFAINSLPARWRVDI